jgi:hypothetical protein
VITHEEYRKRVMEFSDSEADTTEVLAHVGACAGCRKEQRIADQLLSRLESEQPSWLEATVRALATAAVVALVIVGILRPASSSQQTPTLTSPARYRIVGDSRGVVAYTPSGVVVGVSAMSAKGKEAFR